MNGKWVKIKRDTAAADCRGVFHKFESPAGTQCLPAKALCSVRPRLLRNCHCARVAEFFGDKLPWPSPGKAQAVILDKLPDVRERSQRQKMVGPSDDPHAAAAFPLGHYVLFFDEARH